MGCYRSDLESAVFRSKVLFYTGLALAFLACLGGYRHVQLLHGLFLALACWAYILLADNLVYRYSGASTCVSYTGDLVILAAGSTGLCCVLELFNLRFHAWHYVSRPSGGIMRWCGLGLAWAAVIPSLVVTNDVLFSLGAWRWTSAPHLILRHRYLDLALPAGAVLLCLAFAFPDFLWPLVFAAFFIMVEPLNRRLGLPSFLREWEFGLPGKTVRLALAGLICGLLWNACNFAAGSRWVYTGGFGAGPELFGLSLSVYLGFPLFALVMYSLHGVILLSRDLLALRLPNWRLRFAAAALMAAAFYLSLRAVDARAFPG